MTFHKWMEEVKKLIGNERWERNYLFLRDLYYQGESVIRAAQYLVPSLRESE